MGNVTTLCSDCSRSMDLTAVTNGVGSAAGAVSNWTKWLGRQVVSIAGGGWELAKKTAVKALDLVKACWDISKPWIQSMVGFLKSKGGIVSLTITGAVLLGALALKLDDQPGRVALLILSFVVLAFGVWFGCSAGVIPLMT